MGRRKFDYVQESGEVGQQQMLTRISLVLQGQCFDTSLCEGSSQQVT